MIFAGVAAFAAGWLVAAWVHHGYAWRNYQTAKAAVPVARRTWLERLGQLLGTIAILAIAGGLLWLLSTGRQQ